MDQREASVPDRHGARVSPLKLEGGSASPQEGHYLCNGGACLYQELDLGNPVIVSRGGNLNVKFGEWDKVCHTQSTDGLLVPSRQDLVLAA